MGDFHVKVLSTLLQSAQTVCQDIIACYSGSLPMLSPKLLGDVETNFWKSAIAKRNLTEIRKPWISNITINVENLGLCFGLVMRTSSIEAVFDVFTTKEYNWIFPVSMTRSVREWTAHCIWALKEAVFSCAASLGTVFLSRELSSMMEAKGW